MFQLRCEWQEYADHVKICERSPSLGSAIGGGGGSETEMTVECLRNSKSKCGWITVSGERVEYMEFRLEKKMGEGQICRRKLSVLFCCIF